MKIEADFDIDCPSPDDLDPIGKESTDEVDVHHHIKESFSDNDESLNCEVKQEDSESKDKLESEVITKDYLKSDDHLNLAEESHVSKEYQGRKF